MLNLKNRARRRAEPRDEADLRLAVAAADEVVRQVNWMCPVAHHVAPVAVEMGGTAEVDGGEESNTYLRTVSRPVFVEGTGTGEGRKEQE